MQWSHNITNAQDIIDEVKSAIDKFSFYATKYSLSLQSIKMISRELKL